MHSVIFSPFIVPVAMFTMIAILGVAGMFSTYHEKKLKVEQRIAAIARGIPLAEVEKVFGAIDKRDQQVQDPMRSIRNSRLTAAILICGGIGVICTCLLLAFILQVRQVLAGAAGGLIPIAIGIGFVIDYKAQTREMARLGLLPEDEPGR